MIYTLVLSAVEGHVLNRGAMAVRTVVDYSTLQSARLTARRQGSVPFRRVPPAADTRSPAQDQSPEANSRPPGESLPG